MHLYPYAFELLAKTDENINYLAEFSQFSLRSGNSITPNIMSDRYIHYRVEEYLATDKLFLDKKATLKTNFQVNSQETFLSRAGIYHYSNKEIFLTSNLSKNLVLDFYRKKSKKIFGKEYPLLVSELLMKMDYILVNLFQKNLNLYLVKIK